MGRITSIRRARIFVLFGRMVDGSKNNLTEMGNNDENPENGDPRDAVATLLAVLEQDYATLLARLAARLRSPELAPTHYTTPT
jgi:hypothetical protein